MLRLMLFVFLVVFSHGNDLRLQLGKEYQKKGQLEKALKEYRGYIAANPGKVDGYLLAGDLKLKAGDFKGAAQFYQGAMNIDGSSVLALRGMARAQEGKGALEQAIGYYRKITEVTKGNAKEAAEKQIKRLKAKLEGEKVVHKQKVAPARYSYESSEFKQALNLHNQGKNTEALEAWRKVLKKEPGNPGAYYFAGVNRYNLGQLDKAIINFNKGFAYPEKGFNSHYYLGRIYEKQGKNQLAGEHYNMYLERTVNEGGVKEVKGRLEALGVKAGEVGTKVTKGSTQKETNAAVEEAIKSPKVEASFKKLKQGGDWILLTPKDPGNELLIAGWKQYRDGQVSESVSRLKQLQLDYPNSLASKAGKLNQLSLFDEMGLNADLLRHGKRFLMKKPGEPWESQTRFLIAKVYVEEEKSDSARTWLTGAFAGGQFGPTSSHYNKLHAQIQKLAKKDQGAVGRLRQALATAESETDRFKIEMQIAELLEETEAKTAVAHFRNVADQCKEQIPVLCRHAKIKAGDLLYKSKDFKESLKYYQKAIAENADSLDTPWARYQLGNIYRKQDEYQKAIEAYNKVNEMHPGSYWADQALWKRDDTIWRDQYKGTLNPDD